LTFVENSQRLFVEPLFQRELILLLCVCFYLCRCDVAIAFLSF
jgi:hypothetical protein